MKIWQHWKQQQQQKTHIKSSVVNDQFFVQEEVMGRPGEFAGRDRLGGVVTVELDLTVSSSDNLLQAFLREAAAAAVAAAAEEEDEVEVEVADVAEGEGGLPEEAEVEEEEEEEGGGEEGRPGEEEEGAWEGERM